jgi:hypothetical protein
MKLARDDAWEFAAQLSSSPENQLGSLIEIRDQKIAAKASIISNLKPIPNYK